MIKLQVIGNIGQNARVTEINGSKSVNFSVAHNRKYTNKEGVETESTLWVNCTYWRRDNSSVEVAKYLTSGTRVFVEGQPSVDLYQDKNGKYQTSLNLSVSVIELLESKRTGEAPAPGDHTAPDGQNNQSVSKAKPKL